MTDAESICDPSSPGLYNSQLQPASSNVKWLHQRTPFGFLMPRSNPTNLTPNHAGTGPGRKKARTFCAHRQTHADTERERERETEVRPICVPRAKDNHQILPSPKVLERKKLQSRAAVETTSTQPKTSLLVSPSSSLPRKVEEENLASPPGRGRPLTKGSKWHPIARLRAMAETSISTCRRVVNRGSRSWIVMRGRLHATHKHGCF